MTAAPFKGATEGSITPVLQPQDWPNTEFSNGVGSPQVIYDPVDQATKLLFTGWTDQTNRKLFVADIDHALNVTNPQKVASPTDTVGGNTIEGAYAIYDDANNEWIISYSTKGTEGVEVMAVSRDFSTINDKQSYTLSSSDSGATPIASKQGGKLWLTYVDTGNDLWAVEVQGDMTTRPLESSLNDSSAGRLIRDNETRQYYKLDVHHTQMTPAGPLVLIESMENGFWQIYPAFVGNLNGADWYKHTATFSRQPLVRAGNGDGGGQYGHPHYSAVLSRPLVFFCYFRNLESNSYQHEIYAQEPTYELMNPRNWFPFQNHILSGSGDSSYINTHGASELKIFVHTTNTGTVTLKQAPAAGIIGAGEHDGSTSWSLSSTGSHELTHSNPTATVMVNLDFNPIYVDIELRE